MQLRVPQDKVASLSAVRVVGHWDDATSPAIDLPLLGLFAASEAVPNPGTLALTSAVEGNELVLRLRVPMPFQSRAVWDVINTGADAADLTLAWSGVTAVPDQPYGHLSVQYEQQAIPLSSNELNVAQITGRGRLVGLCGDIAGRRESSVLGSMLSNPMDLSRGDVRIMVDGEVALQSTSSDTYADNALYFADSPRATPFAATWNRVADDNADRGQASFCRWHVLGNEIDFKSSLSVTREAAQRDPSIITLNRSVAYVYIE
jgi:hypothetical protein